VVLSKLEVARCQLATASDLFIRDRDPISIQCLACGAGELLEKLARLQGVNPFSTHILEQQPNLDEGRLRFIRNQFWNAFKHISRKDGLPRDDGDIMNAFEDSQNDAALFVAWRDYQAVTGKLPVAAQVFQVWWYSLNETKLGPLADIERIRSLFPNINLQDRSEQKRRLRRTYEKWRNDDALLSDPRTEPTLHVQFF
jgi:hypothetical protein